MSRVDDHTMYPAGKMTTVTISSVAGASHGTAAASRRSGEGPGRCSWTLRSVMLAP
jgi:hypothetical protein